MSFAVAAHAHPPTARPCAIEVRQGHVVPVWTVAATRGPRGACTCTTQWRSSPCWYPRSGDSVLKGLMRRVRSLLGHRPRKAAATPPAVPALRLVHVADVADRGPEERWLVEGLWSRSGVGVVGAMPKVGKTWTVVEFALAVSSGNPAFGHFAVQNPGPVLMFGAEDTVCDLQERVASVAKARGLQTKDLDLHFIDTPALRLDIPAEFERLRQVVVEFGPALLILDTLVRMHRGDENNAGFVAGVLGNLRELQRQQDVGIMVTHHLNKKVKRGGPDGQSLRGSGDLHAWGDSNIYMSRDGDRIRVVAEHRSLPAPEPVFLELRLEPSPHLAVVDGDDAQPSEPAPLRNQVLDVLVARHGAGLGPVSRKQLRHVLGVRNTRLGDALSSLCDEGRAHRVPGGVVFAEPSEDDLTT